jgi:hypothetical protein
MGSSLLRHILGAVCIVVLVACEQQKIEPEIASSAPHASYAQSYPEHVEATVTAFGDDQAAIKETTGKFDEYPGQLEGDVDHDRVADILERADEVGRSRAYVERLREIEGVERFYEAEREELRRKVAGACQYAAKEAGCSGEIGGAGAGALDRVMKERIEERLHEANDAHRMLERDRKKLGEKNAEALEKQIDEVSKASYLAHIELVEHKLHLRRLVEDAEKVKKTADEAIEDEKKYQQESGRSDEEKKASEERVKALRDSMSGVDAAAKKAERALEEIEPRIEKVQKDYKEARDKLLETLRSKAKKS